MTAYYSNIAVACLAEVMADIECNATSADLLVPAASQGKQGIAKSMRMVVNNRLRGGERNTMRWYVYHGWKRLCALWDGLLLSGSPISFALIYQCDRMWKMSQMYKSALQASSFKNKHPIQFFPVPIRHLSNALSYLSHIHMIITDRTMPWRVTHSPVLPSYQNLTTVNPYRQAPCPFKILEIKRAQRR